MNYLEKMTLCQLAEECCTVCVSCILEELEKRDLSPMTYDQANSIFLEKREGSDNQFLLDFAKEKADDSGVKDDFGSEWADGYEVGFKTGVKSGIKQVVENVNHNLKEAEKL